MAGKLFKVVLFAGVFGASAVAAQVPAQAQEPEHVVRGRILDAQTGESLPSANIRIEGTWRGAITNADGAFEIALPNLPAELAFRYIGYESQRRTVADRSVRDIEIRLQPTAIQMPEIVVTGDNPAIGIMRCVIDRKQERRAALSSYAAEAYTRFTVSNDTGVVAITETLSEVFWDKERGMRELVKSRRQTLNLIEEVTSDLEGVLLMLNLYDDDIPILDHNFAGVTHPDALNIYRFSLQGTRLLDDQLVYDIAVAPKSRLSVAFAGNISVLADECALLEVALEPGKAFLSPLPFINFLGTTLYQKYDAFDGSAWLPVDYRSEIGIDISLGLLLRFPTVNARQVSSITDYEIEAALPDSLYAKEDPLGIDQEAIDADTLLDRAGVAIPLEGPERIAFANIDSALTFEKAFKPKGLLARYVTEAGEEDGRDKERTGLLTKISEPIPGVRTRFRFNRAEGFAPGLAVKIEPGRFRFESHGKWSHGRWERDLGQPWSYGVRGSVGFRAEELAVVDDEQDGVRDWAFLVGNGAPRFTLGVAYSDGVESRFGDADESGYAYILSPATIYSLFGSGDYFDYLRNRRISAFGRYAIKEGLRIAVTASRETPSPVEAITAYDLLGKSGAPRPNPPVSERRLHSVSLTGSYGFFHMTEAFLPRFLARSGSLSIEYGKVEGLKQGYVRLGGSFAGDFDTFFSRRPIPNTLDIRLNGGVSFGDIPIHRFETIGGSIGSMRDFGALHTQIGRPYEGDQYIGFFWEHNFRTIPFELLGLRGLARRGYGVILGGGHAYTQVSSSPLVKRPELHLAPDGMHHEITVSLNGIAGMFRVFFARRLDKPDHSIGVGLGASFL